MITAFAATFAAVFLAELPDKTMVASIVLTTRYRRPLAVWTGVACAFAGHVVLAVVVGSLARRLPHRPLEFAVAALFVAGGLTLLRSAPPPVADGEVVETSDEVASFRRVALASAAVVGLAEFGDLTQLATAGLAAKYHQPLAVGLGAWLGLAAVAGLAVAAGRWITSHVSLHVVQRVAGIAFLAFGAIAFVNAVR